MDSMKATDKDDVKNDKKEETVWMEEGEWKKIVFHFGKVAFLMVYIYIYMDYCLKLYVHNYK